MQVHFLPPHGRSGVYLSAGSDLRGQERKHFVVVPLDGDFRVKDMAPSIQAVKKAAANSNGAVGVGLVSMMGFEHTRNELAVSLCLCILAKQTRSIEQQLMDGYPR